MIEPYSREQENYGETDGIVIFLPVICESSVGNAAAMRRHLVHELTGLRLRQ